MDVGRHKISNVLNGVLCFEADNSLNEEKSNRELALGVHFRTWRRANPITDPVRELIEL